MKKALALIATILALALAGCGGGEERGSQSEDGGAPPEEQASAPTESNEAVVGGFSIEGPAGRGISIPATTVEREDVENYVQSVRPIIENTSRDLSQFVDPKVELQDQTLTVSIQAESIEEAQETTEDGLEALQQVQPPEGLEPVHASYSSRPTCRRTPPTATLLRPSAAGMSTCSPTPYGKTSRRSNSSPPRRVRSSRSSNGSRP